MVAHGFLVVANNWVWDLAELASRDGMSVKCKGLMFKSGGATDLGIKPWVGNTMKQSDGADDDDDDNEENEAGAVQQTSAGALMDAPAAQDAGSKFRTLQGIIKNARR